MVFWRVAVGVEADSLVEVAHGGVFGCVCSLAYVLYELVLGNLRLRNVGFGCCSCGYEELGQCDKEGAFRWGACEG